MQTGSGRSADRPRRPPALAEATHLCRQRRVQLTKLRRGLLEILWEQPHRPIGAYPLMRRLEASSGRCTTATSVYRSLDFLLHQGLVVRIESCNAYVPCPTPGQSFRGAFFICDTCGASTCVEDPALERLLGGKSKMLGFSVRRQILELQGVCRECTASR